MRGIALTWNFHSLLCHNLGAFFAHGVPLMSLCPLQITTLSEHKILIAERLWQLHVRISDASSENSEHTTAKALFGFFANPL
jgi:hypothetical protein